jgi:hypothetical protein
MLNEKSRYLFNPVSFYAANYIYTNISAPLLYIQFAPELINIDYYIITFFISLFNLSFVLIGFSTSKTFLIKTAFNLLSLVCLKYSFQTKKFAKRVSSWSFLLVSVCAFVLLAILSGAGTEWITDSRTSYATARESVGVYWVMSIAFLKLSYITVISENKSNNKQQIIVSLTLYSIIFSALSSFLGSKTIILGFPITAIAYYNYYVDPLKRKFLAFSAILVLLSISLTQFFQGTAETWVDTLLYADYFQNTAEFLRRFNTDYEFKLGEVAVSSLWGLVPRSLYPGKPYAYGISLIHQVMFPGAVESGYTPGILPWAGDYLDFGLIGVAASGFLKGLTMGWVNNYFLSSNKSIIGFILFLQIGGISPIFVAVPDYLFLLVFLPCISMYVYLLRPIK